jgi:hypothetical protein
VARETQERRLQRYRDKIDSSRQWRESQGYVELWRTMIDLYRGKQWEGAGEEDKAIVNLAFAVTNIVLASVTTQYPKFTVAPNVMDQDAQATIAEAVLNYSWRHYNFHDEFCSAVVDMCMVGHGWLKVGWRYKEEKETKELTPEEQYGLVDQLTQQADQAAGQAGALAGAVPNAEEIAQQVEPTQEVTKVIEDDPFVERVSPFDVVIDPEACAMRELRWIAQRVVRDLSEVREDENYDARNRRKVQADLSVSSEHDTYRQDRPQEGMEADDDDRVTVWEFYDLVNEEWSVFAQDGEGFLVKPAPIPHPFPNCFVMFRDYDVPDVFYPIGEIESTESLQEELNKTRTQQINARKQFIRKFIAREAGLSTRAREALASEIDGDVAFVTEDDRQLSDIIISAPSLSFDPNLFNAHSTQIVTDFQMVTGLSDYQFGQMPDTRRLATEAMAVEGATNARSSFKLTRVEHTLALVGRYLLQIMQTYLDGQRAARVAGPGGEMLFNYTAEDIKGEFDLQVEAGSTQPKNDMIRRQEAVTLFNTLAPFMGILVNGQELVRYLLQQGYDIKSVERFMAVPPPPAMAPGAPPGEPGQPALGPPGAGQPGAPAPVGAPAGALPPEMMGAPPTNGAPAPVPA